MLEEALNIAVLRIFYVFVCLVYDYDKNFQWFPLGLRHFAIRKD